MTGKSDAHADAILNLIRSLTTIDPGTSSWDIHITLFRTGATDPLDSAAGTEPAGVGYARQGISTWSIITDNVTSGRQCDVNEVISWTGWDSGTLTIGWAGLFTAVTGGTFLYWDTLTTNRTIENSETATFAANSIVVIEN